MKNDLNIFKDAKHELHNTVFTLAMRKMTLDNISKFIPDILVVTCPSYTTRKIALKFNTDNVTADIFDKTVEKLSKRLMQNPSVYINEHYMDAAWEFRFQVKNLTTYIRLELSTNNTEACEVVTKTTLRTETELTGYCKLLQEKKYYAK